MKRFILSATVLGAAFLFIGCGDTTEKKTTDKVTSPGGTTTTTTTDKVNSTGSNPPANAGGETGTSAKPK